MHLPDDGSTENALKLGPAELAKREITWLDIGKDKLDPTEAVHVKIDPSEFHSQKANRGPLKDGWQVAQVLKCLEIC